MMALRHATLMFAALLLTGVPPAAAQTGAQRSFPSSFEAFFKTHFTRSCIEGVKESTGGRIPEASIANYCECSLNGALKEFTTIEMLKAYFANKAPPATQAKLDGVVKTCGDETLRPALR
jgi:hypothetical protein